MTAAGAGPPTRVVLYHCIAPPIDDGAEGSGHRPEMGMITAPEVLEAHVTLLRDRGYRFVTAGELARLWRGSAPHPGLAVLTFDDGWRDGLTTVAPMLARLGVRATFFVCPGGFGNVEPRLGEAGVMMTEAEALELHAAGMELASHTISHRGVLELSDAELREEFVGSREAVEEITRRRCLTLAYPSGRHDARVERAAADAGYELAFACVNGPWQPFAAPRVGAPTTARIEAVARRLALPELADTQERSSWASTAQLRS